MATGSLRLPPLPTIRDVIKLYKIGARKQLSQNFLTNDRLSDKIVKQAGRLNDSVVIEVGPGPGNLTRSIIRRSPKRIILVEKDKRFNPMLRMLGEAYANVNGRMDIIWDDILRTNIAPMISTEETVVWEERCPNICIIGNLPFSLATHLIIRWFEAISQRSGLWSFGRTRMILTFQKEIAERLVAPINHAQRCRLSVMAQAWTEPRLRFLIPGSAFVPKPDVDVGVVSFIPRKKPMTNHDFKFFEKVTRHAFSFRRKYSIKCIGTLFPPDYREELSTMMYKLSDIDPTTRPYELTVDDMHRLCSAYKYLLDKHPEILHYDYRASRKIIGGKYLRRVEVEDMFEEEDEDLGDDDFSDDETETPGKANVDEKA